MIVKIIACSNQSLWYKYSIGKTFKVYEDNENFYVLSEDICEDRQRGIFKKDCEIVRQEIKEKFPTLESIGIGNPNAVKNQKKKTYFKNKDKWKN